MLEHCASRPDGIHVNLRTNSQLTSHLQNIRITAHSNFRVDMDIMPDIAWTVVVKIVFVAQNFQNLHWFFNIVILRIFENYGAFRLFFNRTYLSSPNPSEFSGWNDFHLILTVILFILSRDEKCMAKDQIRLLWNSNALAILIFCVELRKDLKWNPFHVKQSSERKSCKPVKNKGTQVILGSWQRWQTFGRTHSQAILKKKKTINIIFDMFFTLWVASSV